ncbi:pilus motility taxis protein HmpF [Geitlerinema sp. PCC 9228]|uniref:pilus motility taxis protein HmpF n=1 Tax=Geitlerinema sp. PCC 9228 TaxID=111611 RepID=UPI0031BAD310
MTRDASPLTDKWDNPHHKERHRRGILGVLYLAEVQKSKGVFGGKAQLKLLACQRGEQSWNAVNKNPIPAEEANGFNSGALVLVELDSNDRIKKPPQEAGRGLVSILQNFSRLQEKYKNQEEEIEQWKQSLTFQSQELNRREAEMEARREELEQMQQEVEQLQAQRQEIENAQQQAQQLQEEAQRRQKELDEAAKRIEAEKRQLQEQQQHLQQASSLNSEQVQRIQELLNQISGAVAPTDTVREAVNEALNGVDSHQSLLDGYWQDLENQQAQAEQQQAEVDRLQGEIDKKVEELRQSQDSLENARSALRVQRETLHIKQEYAQSAANQLRNQEELYQQIFQLVETTDEVNISERVDMAELENMSLEEIQGKVQQLQQELERMSRFVNDQEEELNLERDTISQLQQQLEQAGSNDERDRLETELADEQDHYQMLNETLVGQRRNLRERQEILAQHQEVLWRRLGNPDMKPVEKKIDLGPILRRLDEQRQEQEQESKNLEAEVENMRSGIQQAEDAIAHQEQEHQELQNELDQMRQQWHEQSIAVAQIWGRVNLYREILQPIQDALNQLRSQLESAIRALNQVQETGDYQLQSIAELQRTVQDLGN